MLRKEWMGFIIPLHLPHSHFYQQSITNLQKKLSWLKWKMLYIFYHNKNVSSKKLFLNTQPINLYMILSFVFWLLVESHHNQL